MASRDNKQTVIIMKKRGRKHHAHHGGAWKVAYADFVTAMMAFFLVMWIVGQNKAVKASVASYFTDPVAYEEKLRAGLLDGSSGFMEESGSAFTILEKNSNGLDQNIRGMLEEAGREILNDIMDIPELAVVAELIEVHLANEGLRIELQEASESTFFDLGSPHLSPKGVEAVTAIGRVIATLDMDVAVEGHTDSRPYGTGYGTYTNWELSSDRANSARRLLISSGVNRERIVEIRGYADTNLKYPETPLDPRNRRISIIVFNRVMAERSLNSELAPVSGDSSQSIESEISSETEPEAEPGA